MKKIVRLTESDLNRLVKRIVMETKRPNRLIKEVLDNLTDTETMSDWVYNELYKYCDTLSDYGSHKSEPGYHVIIKLSRLLHTIGVKMGWNKTTLDYVENNYNNQFRDDNNYVENKDGEGKMIGTIKLNDVELLSYESHEWGYPFMVKINSNFKQSIENFINSMEDRQ